MRIAIGLAAILVTIGVIVWIMSAITLPAAQQAINVKKKVEPQVQQIAGQDTSGRDARDSIKLDSETSAGKMTSVLVTAIDDGGRITRWYVVRDLGAALGETGRLAPKRNNIEEFEQETFISRVSDNFVEFKYSGWQPGLLHHTISVEDVQWAVGLLAGLSDRQWRDAFRAGGYREELSERFIRKLKANIAAGQRLPTVIPPSRGERR